MRARAKPRDQLLRPAGPPDPANLREIGLMFGVIGQDPANLRYTRILGTREYRRNFELDGGYGTALQGLAAAEYRPGGKVGADDVH